jgi:hypothetical protein
VNAVNAVDAVDAYDLYDVLDAGGEVHNIDALGGLKRQSGIKADISRVDDILAMTAYIRKTGKPYASKANAEKPYSVKQCACAYAYAYAFGTVNDTVSNYILVSVAACSANNRRFIFESDNLARQAIIQSQAVCGDGPIGRQSLDAIYDRLRGYAASLLSLAVIETFPGEPAPARNYYLVNAGAESTSLVLIQNSNSTWATRNPDDIKYQFFRVGSLFAGQRLIFSNSRSFARRAVENRLTIESSHLAPFLDVVYKESECINDDLFLAYIQEAGYAQRSG